VKSQYHESITWNAISHDYLLFPIIYGYRFKYFSHVWTVCIYYYILIKVKGGNIIWHCDNKNNNNNTNNNNIIIMFNKPPHHPSLVYLWTWVPLNVHLVPFIQSFDKLHYYYRYILCTLLLLYFSLSRRNAMIFHHKVGFYFIIEVVSGFCAHANCRRVKILFTDKTSNLNSCFETRPP